MREALCVGAVRHSGKQVLRDLRLLRGAPSARPPAAHSAAARRHSVTPPPSRDVVVDEVDCVGVDQTAHAVARDLRLAGGDRDASCPAHARHHRGVVVPVAGLLEPADVERLDSTREADRLDCVPAPVGVDGQDEIGPGRLACGLSPASASSSGERPPTLNLQPSHSGFAVLLHLAPDVGERLAFHVVAADRDDRQTVAVAAEQLARRSCRASCRSDPTARSRRRRSPP